VSFPYQNWQFWVVTLAVAASFGWLLRGVLPVPFLKRRRARRLRQRRVTLTVGGKRPG
jgi:hypothetical protein